MGPAERGARGEIPLRVLLIPQRPGVPGASWLPRGRFQAPQGAGGGGGVRQEGFQSDAAWTSGGSMGGQPRGFFLEGLVRPQGRDASDQHIVTVMLKMMQGERARQPLLFPIQVRAVPPFSSFSEWPCPRGCRPGDSFQLCFGEAGILCTSWGDGVFLGGGVFCYRSA